MGLITWNTGLETGHRGIDAQHQALVEAYNSLQTALSQGRAKEDLETALEALRDCTVRHFSWEEELMDQAQYGGARAHKILHADLLAQIRELAERYQRDKVALTLPVMDFLEGWLIYHIKDEDARLVAFLR